MRLYRQYVYKSVYMKTNYFREPIPSFILLSLLGDLCVVINKCFIIDMPTYYNGVHKGSIQKFMEDCKPYYLPSKQFYTTVELTYKSFLTVVRHICKINSIEYNNHIQYCHSIYQVVYHIVIPPDYVIGSNAIPKNEDSKNGLLP
jgi:hypothetical protein